MDKIVSSTPSSWSRSVSRTEDETMPQSLLNLSDSVVSSPSFISLSSPCCENVLEATDNDGSDASPVETTVNIPLKSQQQRTKSANAENH